MSDNVKLTHNNILNPESPAPGEGTLPPLVVTRLAEASAGAALYGTLAALSQASKGYRALINPVFKRRMLIQVDGGERAEKRLEGFKGRLKEEAGTDLQ